MRRLDFLRSQIEQCKQLARALPPGTVQRELEKLAREYQNEIDSVQSEKLQPKD